MSLFGNLTSADTEKRGDVLGGGYSPIESDVYNLKIKAAYLGKAASSAAQSVSFIFTLEDGREHRETLWITTKKGECFYANPNGGKTQLPGFEVFNDIVMATLGHEVADITDDAVEQKVLELWDSEAGKEIPKPVNMIMPLIGQSITIALKQELVNKQAKQADGSYADTDETRTNVVSAKVFHAESGMTIEEAKRNGGWDASKATFKDKWLEVHKGQINDRTTNKSASTAKPKGLSLGAADKPAKKSGLFGT